MLPPQPEQKKRAKAVPPTCSILMQHIQRIAQLKTSGGASTRVGGLNPFKNFHLRGGEHNCKGMKWVEGVGGKNVSCEPEGKSCVVVLMMMMMMTTTTTASAAAATATETTSSHHFDCAAPQAVEAVASAAVHSSSSITIIIIRHHNSASQNGVWAIEAGGAQKCNGCVLFLCVSIYILCECAEICDCKPHNS